MPSNECPGVQEKNLLEALILLGRKRTPISYDLI
jgi:hypothetical protein